MKHQSPPNRPRRRRLIVPVVVGALSAAGVWNGGADTAQAQIPGTAAPAPTTTVTVTDTSDTFVSTGAVRANHGADRVLHAGAGATTYLRFQLTAAQATGVESADLVLTRTRHHLPSTVIAVHIASSSFTASTSTPITQPVLSTSIATTTADPSTNHVDLDVTAAAVTRTVTLAVTSTNAGDVAEFRSREAGLGSPKLVLALNATPGGCAISPLLVSSCQVWLGDAPQAYSGTPVAAALATDEAAAARRFDLVHQYNANGHLFPSTAAIRLAQQGRILFENWKPATDMSWAQVAQDRADARIDAEAAYLRAHFDEPFLLAIWHEPEDNVDPAVPGMGAADYVAMYRHVVLRLRADGAGKFVSVMNYMGYARWRSLFAALYPGSDVVDWIAWDPYIHHASDAPGHDFAALVDPHPGADFYTWVSSAHPGTPLMLGEFGAVANYPAAQAAFFTSLSTEIGSYPTIDALSYFNICARAHVGDGGDEFQGSRAGLSAFQTMASTEPFIGPGISYAGGRIASP